jgi:hypothetical protein
VHTARFAGTYLRERRCHSGLSHLVDCRHC